MRSARILAPVIILVIMVTALSMQSCGGDVSSKLDGTWDLVTSKEPGTEDVWNGTYTIELTSVFPINDLTYEFYRGEILWETEPFIIRVERRKGVEAGEYDYILNIYRGDEDFADNSIKMLGYMSGYSNASGSYIGVGTYWPEFGGPYEPPDGDWGGTFTTNRQE